MHAITRAGLCLAALAIPAAIVVAQPGATPPPAGKAMHRPMTKADAETRAMTTFDRFDTDHDGYITRAEAEAGKAQMREAMAGRMKSKRDARFVRMDADKNGSISRAEYDAAGDRQMKMAMRDAPPRPPVPLAPPRDGAAPPVPPRPPMPGMASDGMGHRMMGHRMMGHGMMGHGMMGGGGMGMMAMFDRIDADHDGRISRAEAKAIADMHFAMRDQRPMKDRTPG